MNHPTPPTSDAIAQAARLIQGVVPWCSEAAQADLRRAISLLGAVNPKGVSEPLEAAEIFLQLATEKFMERAMVDPSTGYPELSKTDENFYEELHAVLTTVISLNNEVPAVRDGTEDMDHD